MKLSLLSLSYLSSVVLANTAFVPSSSKCVSVEKMIAPKDGNVAKRDPSLNHCGVTGYLKKRDSEGPSQNHISLHHCANYCVCTLGKNICKSFEWTESPAEKGLGHCRTHTITLNKRNHRPRLAKRDVTAEPLFFNNDCFHEVKREVEVMTRTPPPIILPPVTPITTKEPITIPTDTPETGPGPEIPPIIVSPGIPLPPELGPGLAEPPTEEKDKREAKKQLNPNLIPEPMIPVPSSEPPISVVFGEPVPAPTEPVLTTFIRKPGRPVPTEPIIGEPIVGEPTQPVMPIVTDTPVPQKRDAIPDKDNLVDAALLGV